MSGRISNTLLAILGGAILVTGATWIKPASASEPFLGQIQYFGFNFAPRGWSHCNGQLLAVSSNTALFSLLGTIYGGDGRTTFALPDMQGRFPIHAGTGPGLSPYRIGQKGGTEQVTLNSTQIANHNHTLHGTTNLGDQSSPAGGTLARDGRDQTYANVAPNTDMHAGSIAPSGGGGAHNNMPPFLGVYCSIALTGTYPSRS